MGNFINTLSLKTLILQLTIKCLWPTFFPIIISTHLQNDLHFFKINSSDILFNSSLIEEEEEEEEEEEP